MEPRTVFVSYVEEDRATVLALTRELRALGRSTWTFEEDGVGGRSYLEEVHDAVSVCPVFLLIGSKASVHAHQILKEVELAHAEQRIIIPVLLDLTVDEFRSAHAIIKMATGTTVPLIAGAADPSGLATRIHTALANRGIGTQENPQPSQSVPDFNKPFRGIEWLKCDRCNGTGKCESRQKPGKWNKCKQCNGTGRMKNPLRDRPLRWGLR